LNQIFVIIKKGEIVEFPDLVLRSLNVLMIPNMWYGMFNAQNSAYRVRYGLDDIGTVRYRDTRTSEYHKAGTQMLRTTKWSSS
jgi:signal peptidase I